MLQKTLINSTVRPRIGNIESRKIKLSHKITPFNHKHAKQQRSPTRSQRKGHTHTQNSPCAICAPNQPVVLNPDAKASFRAQCVHNIRPPCAICAHNQSSTATVFATSCVRLQSVRKSRRVRVQSMRYSLLLQNILHHRRPHEHSISSSTCNILDFHPTIRRLCSNYTCCCNQA
jgi:hypothetical protein